MRNPERIDKILNLIKKVWKQNPDLRLFQLLGNPFEPEDHYHTEDDELEEKLENYYNE